MDCVNNSVLDRLSNAGEAGTPYGSPNGTPVDGGGLKMCQEISVESSSSAGEK